MVPCKTNGSWFLRDDAIICNAEWPEILLKNNENMLVLSFKSYMTGLDCYKRVLSVPMQDARDGTT